jgi:hypothetical protein
MRPAPSYGRATASSLVSSTVPRTGGCLPWRRRRSKSGGRPRSTTRLDREDKEWIEKQKRLEKEAAEQYIYGERELPQKWNPRQADAGKTAEELPEEQPPKKAKKTVQFKAETESRSVNPIFEDIKPAKKSAKVPKSILKTSSPSVVKSSPKIEELPDDDTEVPAKSQSSSSSSCIFDDEPEPPLKAVTTVHSKRDPPVRTKAGAIKLNFSAREHPGLPARESREPPMPKEKSDSKDRRDAIEGGNEDNPVWLKERGDTLAAKGDFQGAINAYTTALKIRSNARCFANRALCRMAVGQLEEVQEYR